MLNLSTGLRDALLDLDANGGSGWAELFTNCIIRIYEGTMPASADAIAGGTLLVEITESGLPFVAGQPGNGLNFGQVANGTISAASGETWEGTATANGAPNYFRIFDNAVVVGASVVEIRADGTIGIIDSGEDMEADTIQFLVDKVVSITGVTLTIPA
jgi:hypothetical protein